MTTTFNIWTPEGTIVSGGSIGNPSLIYDTNPVILTGDTEIFKMLYGDYNAGTIYYQESTTCLPGTWSAYSSNPLTLPENAAIYFPTMWKVGSTYYLFGSPNEAFGSIVLYTASSPVGPFTSQGTVVNVGSAGSWDSQGVAQLNLCAIVNGTWYAYYWGTKGSFHNGCGLVTSTDGIHWTKTNYSSTTPLLASVNYPTFQCGPANFQYSNGTYYAWCGTDYNNTTLQSNQFHAIGRWSASSPEGPWTQLMYNGNPVMTYYPASTADMLNNDITTQLGDQCMVSALGNLYLMYDLGTDGSEGVVNVAVASNTTVAQLVTTYEGVVGAPSSGNPSLNLTTLATDPGTGTNANPAGGNWTTNPNYFAIQRNSNLLEPSSTTAGDRAGIAYWNPISWSNDQWASVVAAASASSSTAVAVSLRQAVPAKTLYYIDWAGELGTTGGWNIVKIVAGTATTLQNGSGSLKMSVGDTLMGVVNGSLIYCYWNGALIGVASDSSITSGEAGIYIQGDGISTSDAAVSSWSAGFFQSSPIIGSTAYSVPDCRNFGNFPNNFILTNNTEIFTVQQFESRTAGAPVDSRTAGAPIASGTYPQNSRSPGTFGPNE
jgi:hypothetical protein